MDSFQRENQLIIKLDNIITNSQHSTNKELEAFCLIDHITKANYQLSRPFNINKLEIFTNNIINYLNNYLQDKEDRSSLCTELSSVLDYIPEVSEILYYIKNKKK